MYVCIYNIMASRTAGEYLGAVIELCTGSEAGSYLRLIDLWRCGPQGRGGD